jgi:chromatin remodeling complex protein RSC6
MDWGGCKSWSRNAHSHTHTVQRTTTGQQASPTEESTVPPAFRTWHKNKTHQMNATKRYLHALP